VPLMSRAVMESCVLTDPRRFPHMIDPVPAKPIPQPFFPQMLDQRWKRSRNPKVLDARWEQFESDSEQSKVIFPPRNWRPLRDREFTIVLISCWTIRRPRPRHDRAQASGEGCTVDGFCSSLLIPNMQFMLTSPFVRPRRQDNRPLVLVSNQASIYLCDRDRLVDVLHFTAQVEHHSRPAMEIRRR